MNTVDYVDELRLKIMAECYSPEKGDPLGRLRALIELRAMGANVTVVSRESFGPDTLVTKRVALPVLASIFQTHSAAKSGTLPPNTVFWGMANGYQQVGVYHRPARYRLMYAGRELDMPMPALLFCSYAGKVSLYALKGDSFPTDDTPLFYPPMPNIFNDGRVCTGENRFGDIDAGSITAVWNDLISSEFTPHLIAGRCASYSSSIYDLWNDLDGADTFPEDELVGTGKTVASIQE